MRCLLSIAVVMVACGDDGGGQVFMDAPAVTDAPKIDAPRGDGSMSTVDAAVAIGPACSGTTCMNGTEECCLGAAMNICIGADTCPSQGFKCDGPEDCTGGDTCCYANNAGSECKAQNCQEIACHDATDCPATMMCCPKIFTPNYNVCQTQC